MNFFKKHYKLNLLLIIFSFSIISCSSDDDDDGPTIGGEKITYNKHVKTIIDANCLGCHGADLDNGAPVHLTNYDEVKVSSAKVAKKVADGSMPKGGSLTEAQKKTIANWAKGGYLEK